MSARERSVFLARAPSQPLGGGLCGSVGAGAFAAPAACGRPRAQARGLVAGELRLWTTTSGCRADDPHLYDTLLSPAEREAARNFAPTRRAQFASGRALARLALSRCCPVPPRAWMFAVDASGRPRIATPREYGNLHFSLSHTDGLTACLVSRIERAAVDVEKIVMWDDLPRVAPSILSARELSDLASMSGPAWFARFFDYWTLKEAYGKACGSGLELDLRGIEFHLGAEDEGVRARIRGQAGDPSSRWRFWRLALRASHAMALAVGPPLLEDCTLVHRNVGIVGTGEALALEEV